MINQTNQNPAPSVSSLLYGREIVCCINRTNHFPSEEDAGALSDLKIKFNQHFYKIKSQLEKLLNTKQLQTNQ